MTPSAASSDDGVIEQADAENADIQFDFRGEPTWFEIPRERLPPNLMHIHQPVCPVRQAFYGLQRSCFDFSGQLAEQLLKAGWDRFIGASRSMFRIHT